MRRLGYARWAAHGALIGAMAGCCVALVLLIALALVGQKQSDTLIMIETWMIRLWPASLIGLDSVRYVLLAIAANGVCYGVLGAVVGAALRLRWWLGLVVVVAIVAWTVTMR
jgi:hypothetical protein